MNRIVWLASYPKSGNTWFRVFIANLTSDSDQPIDINALHTGGIASARDPFDRYAGVEASDLTAEEIDRLRPEVYLQMAADAEETRYQKVHDAYTLSSAGRPLFPAEATRGVLYFLRNPLDVAVSYAHHSGRDADTAIRWMGQGEHCMCGGPRRLSSQLRQRLLTWSGHVLSWIDQGAFPVCVVRYEDMRFDTEATFTRAARFAGLPDDPERVRRAIELSSFEELQRQESEHGFNERMPRADSFFRKGQVGSWRESLSGEQAARIIADHRPVMARFGYLDDDGEPAF